ncbi:MAG: LysR family transcriptional regulator [Clostridiales Family XIII bacterium]|jgi:DNA-binding transcriptional LysR family regulator|nr:LysR family transcriptional regulator [Clostridiales Family XIII bacterium]
MDIMKYDAFLKIVELGSLTKAADELGYTQAGISHILNSVEKEWGLSLLTRDRSGVRLTSEGIQLLPLIRNVYLANQDLQNEIGEIHGLDSGLIRIGGLASLAAHWLPEVIKAFRLEYPHINFELIHGDYRDIEDWVREGRIDCGLLKLPIGEDLESINIGKDNLVVILPEDHPLAGRKYFPPQSLSDEPLLLVEDMLEQELAEFFNKFQIKPDVRFVSSDDYAVIAMVEIGLGISLLPELLLRRTPYKIVVKDLKETSTRELGVAVRDSKHASPAVRRFLDFVKGSPI